MKTLNLIAAFWVCLVGAIRAIEPTWTPEDRVWEAKQVALWEDNLAKASSLPPSEKFEALALGLRNMGHRVSMTDHSPAVNQIYKRLQQEFLSIPGHATYYRDKLQAGQAEVRAGAMPLHEWQNLRMYSFQTLRQMPSEETVEVLAGFVDDNFADLSIVNPEAWKIPRNSIMDYRDNTVNDAAANALEGLGIEPPPYQDRTKLRNGEFTTRWSQWWQEVKAGKRKYRFKGSSVEHPVNAPPGTFREQRRPERHPESAPGTKAAEKPMPSSAKNQATELKSPKWPMWAGIGAVILALAAYLLKLRGRK